MAKKEYKYVGVHAQDLPSGRVLAPGEVDKFDEDEVNALVTEGTMVLMEELKAEEPDVSEAAAKLANEKGINLADVKGTGKDGSVTKDDVANYISEHGDPTEDGEEEGT